MSFEKQQGEHDKEESMQSSRTALSLESWQPVEEKHSFDHHHHQFTALANELHDRLSDETRQINDKTRDGAIGGFINTGDGITHYELSGKADAPTVVLVHGVSGPMKAWDHTVKDLTDAGFRVLRYDLMGRGLSDRVSNEYNADVYDKQLNGLIEKLEIKQPVTVVGSSMGGIISAEFANRHPEKVKSVVLMGPAGFPIERSLDSNLLFIPAVRHSALGSEILAEHHKKYFYQPEKFPEMQQAYEDQLKFKGTKDAIFSTMQHMPISDFHDGYEKLGKSQVPVLLLWGDKDVTFPFENHKKAESYIPQAQFVPIANAGHLPQYEQYKKTDLEIISFLRTQR